MFGRGPCDKNGYPKEYMGYKTEKDGIKITIWTKKPKVKKY